MIGFLVLLQLKFKALDLMLQFLYLRMLFTDHEWPLPSRKAAIRDGAASGRKFRAADSDKFTG